MAEDIVQESYLVLWEHVREIASEKAKPFLFTTAYRKMIDIFRREKRNSDIETVSSSHNWYENETPDLQQVLHAALERLSEIQRTVVLLRDYENYSYKEIAEITNLNENQVKVYLFRARFFMKEYIRKPDLVV